MPATDTVLRSIHKLHPVLALVLLSVSLPAKDRRPKPPAQDQIQVIAHIPAGNSPVTRFLGTQHYRRNYLYAEEQSGKKIAVIDITDLNHPRVLGEMSDPAGVSDDLVAVTGTAALVEAANRPSTDPPAPQTFRILNFGDPLHPKVEREFRNVTAVDRDDRRGLIFLANSDGIWILQQQFAPDPQGEKEWEHMMLDAR